MPMIFRRFSLALIAALLAGPFASAQDSLPSPVPAQPMLMAAGPVGEVPPPPPGPIPAPANLPAQDAVAVLPTPELTLETCIARALEKNFDLEIGRYNPQIAKDNIEVVNAGYETQLTVTGTHGKSSYDATTYASARTSTNSDLRAGVSQRLYSGTTVSASSKLDRADSSALAATTLNPAYNADLTLAVRQSLLSGFGTDVNRASLQRAEIGLQRANLDFKGQVLVVIQNTQNAYFILAAAREQLAVRNFSLALANKLYDEAKTRRDTGVATDLDVLSADVGVANARRNVVLAEQTVQDRQDLLQALIGQFELNAPVGTVRFYESIKTVPNFASSYEMAKANQPEYLSAKAAIEQYKLDLKITKDSTKPDLTVGAAVGLNGQNKNFNAFGDAINQQNQSWQVDFAFTYPWGQPSDKARYRQSLSTLSREETRLRQLEQSIEVEVRAAVRSVETNLESVKIAKLASELSAKQYELEKARFDAGLSTSRRVLEAQSDLEANRVNELLAKVTLHTAFAALHRLEGSSLQRYGVVLP
jgi:outer membrane protein